MLHKFHYLALDLNIALKQKELFREKSGVSVKARVIPICDQMFTNEISPCPLFTKEGIKVPLYQRRI
jgi:hypothetical protein